MRKSKKVLGILISVCMLISLVPTFVSAAAAGTTFTAGDFTYKVNTDTTTVTLTAIAATKLTGAVTVPATVSDGTTTYTVTHLGDAFKNQGAKTAEMTNLVLPDTMTNFTGTATFYGCKFTSIHLPKNLIKDGSSGYGNCLYNTFQWCSNLTEVTLPASITACYGTFQNSAVKTVTITGTSAVSFYCDSGTEAARAWKTNIGAVTIYYPEGGAAPTRISGYGIKGSAIALASTFTNGDFTYKVNDDGTTVTLTAIAAEKLSGEVIVPATVISGKTYTVTHLGDAFKNQGTKTAEMTSLVLPDTITKFTGTATFYGCKGLEFIHLPKNLVKDGSAGYGNCLYNTFQWCSNLKTVTLPASITACVGTFIGSGVRTVTITGTGAVSFYCDSGTETARAWTSGTTGITIYYPEGGTAPIRTSGYGTVPTVINKTVAEKSIYISSVNASEDTVSINLLNCNTVAVTGDINVFCAFYSKADESLVDIGIASIDSVSAYDVDTVTVDMNGAYDADDMFVKVFVWEEGTLNPFADARTLN